MFLIWRLKPDVAAWPRRQGRRLHPPEDAAPRRTIRVYTPHGGSLHYPLNTLKGAFYSRLERALMNNTDLFLFESAFARDTYQRTIGTPKGLVRCVFNGVTADEFDPVVKAADATDVVYVGEFRHIKGADLLIDAVARLRADGKPVTLTLAGDGEEIGCAQGPGPEARPCRGGALHRPRQGALRLFQGQPAGRSIARGFDALCRDRGGRGGNSDGRRQCRRHSGDLRTPYRRAVCAQHRRRDGGCDRDRARRIPPPRRSAPNRCAKESSCISRRRRWSKACWPATATRLQIVNRSLPTITVSSDLSVKP